MDDSDMLFLHMIYQYLNKESIRGIIILKDEEEENG